VNGGAVLTIASTSDPDGAPVCQLTWGPVQWYAGVAEVRQTAMDLLSVAAYAEWIHLLIARLDLAPPVVEQITADLMRASGRTTDHGHADTVMLYPASGRRKGRRESVIIVKRGALDGMVTVPEGRAMARQWLEVAEATESDQLVAEALRGTGVAGGTARLVFAYLRELRDRAGAAAR